LRHAFQHQGLVFLSS